MAGIYIHIPFCKQACCYCNFHFSTSLKNKNKLIEALVKEVLLQKDFFSNTHTGDISEYSNINTIYIGGGTPSILHQKEIERILHQINLYFTIAPDCEITLEANPDDMTPDKCREWRAVGINRLSIGIQSFFEEDLQWMNRAHDAERAIQCIEEARQAGFENFSADLIFGMPTLNDDHWESNIDRMLSLEVPHLSCYAITVEPKTPLDYFIRQKKYPPVNEEQAARQFEILMERLSDAGYEHYEISNFALPGKRSQHNSNYWRGKPYLGLGPAAHSYNGKTRQWNVANNVAYIQSLAANKIPCEAEMLSKIMQLNEYIMTSLRTMEGCDLHFVADHWGKAESEKLETESKKFMRNKRMVLDKNHLILTNKGKLFADGIAAELFR